MVIDNQSSPPASRCSCALLLLLLLSAFIFSCSAISSDHHHHFEGFDSDDLDDDIDGSDLSEGSPIDLPSPPLSTPTIYSPEPDHIPPSSDPVPAPKKQTQHFDNWDEDEFEGIPVISSDPDPEPIPEQTPIPEPPIQSTTSPPKSLRSYTVEIVCISFLIAFVINYFAGRKENETIALSWASRFAAAEDSIFVKNFSLLGTGDGKNTPLLLKEGQDVFKFYASGRRFCQRLLATMELRSRHDLISRLIDLLIPRSDTITFEVVMNDDSMDHVMMAVARKKMAKSMQKEVRDLQRYAGLMNAPTTGRKWVADDLLVVTESKEVAGDLITEAVLDQVLGEKAFEKFGKWFICMHFSDQYPGSQKKVLVFKFVLPDANKMDEITRLVALVPYYIDLVGRYKLSSQVRSKTEAARAKAAQETYKELQNARQEELQKRKAEKKKLMEEAEGKLSAEAARKREEKERARQLKKSMPRVKMMRGN